MVEVDDADFDILLLTETWRSEREQFSKTNDGQILFLSGSSLGHAGVGICISTALSRDVLDVTFHAYSERLCALHLSFGHRKFQIFACYYPTSWAPDADVEGVYELLNLLLANCWQSGAIPIQRNGNNSNGTSNFGNRHWMIMGDPLHFKKTSVHWSHRQAHQLFTNWRWCWPKLGFSMEKSNGQESHFDLPCIRDSCVIAGELQIPKRLGKIWVCESGRFFIDVNYGLGNLDS